MCNFVEYKTEPEPAAMKIIDIITIPKSITKL